MKTATEKYHAVLEGRLSEAEFIRQMRQAYPQYITQWNGYNDSVSILKQKQLIFEKKEAKKDIDVLADQFPLNVIERGIDYELEAQKIDSTGNVSKEDYMKARVKVIANLQKDQNHYINLLAGESSKVDKHDQMVEPKKGNEVDVHNGLKKADLKEEVGVPTAFDDKSMEALLQIILKYVEDPDEAEAAVQKVDDHGLDSLPADLLANLDRDPQYKAWYKDLHGIKESNQEESIADYIIKYYSNPKTGKSLIDDEIINDFFKTHPESRDQEPEDALDNFQEFLSVNYEMPGDYMQEGQDDMHAIGLGYLKGFGKKHSLTDDDLKKLGQKVVDSLYKGDVEAAKAKFVGEVMGIDRKGNQKPKTGGSDASKYKVAARDVKQEAMSDAEMDAIKNYGQKPQELKTYQLGDKWSNDFDYDGMLKAGLKVRLNTPIDKMQALFDSFEDVNYHSEGSHLSFAIDAAKEGDKSGVLDNLKRFRAAIKKTLGDINEGANPNRRAEINERVGALQDFISLIQDRAEESGFSEAEEAEEVIYALGDHYGFGVDILHGPKNEPEEFTPGEEISEGRRAKSKGGKVVTENDYETGGYVEAMGPIFDKAVKMLLSAWEEWKDGPMTEPGMVEFAKKDVLEFLDSKLVVQNLEEETVTEEPNEGNKFEEERLKAIKAGKKEFSVDGKTFPVKGAGDDEKKRAAMMKENIKAIIVKVLEEGVINEAATNALAEFSETYGSYEGMKQAIIALQDIVTDIESYYDKTRSKIQKVYNTLGEIRNEEGLKVGGFLAPAIEQAFNKDLRPAVKGGFTKGLDQPKVRVLTQADIDAHNSGERPLGEEEKQTVFSAPSINGTLGE